MSLWVKLCGISNMDQLEWALSSGADAIGLVMTASVRQVNIDRAAELANAARGSLTTVGVFFEPEVGLVEKVRDVVGVDLFQAEPEFLSVVEGIEILPVVHDGQGLGQTLESAREIAARRVLVESSGHGGFGEEPDWGRVGAMGDLTDVVVAGGLRPDNVEDVVSRVRPGGVDVSSGIETSPGLKDAVLMKEFVTVARAAADGVVDAGR